MIKISDMTSRSYFGKMNSTLGSVVPLAMFTFSLGSWVDLLSVMMRVLISCRNVERCGEVVEAGDARDARQ